MPAGPSESEAVPVFDGLIIGRSPECGLVLDDSSVSRQHAKIESENGTWFLEDLGSRSGTYLNGRLFRRESIVIGDSIGIGPFHFRFDGAVLHPAGHVCGAALQAENLVTVRGGNRLLDAVSLTIEPGQFVGILGPSGAGKSTLLDALCGLRPQDSGQVWIDGIALDLRMDELRDHLGYVPQDDIVPAELPVKDALYFSARLRMPRGTPIPQIHQLVKKTAAMVGLGERMETPVGRLSGGQRKRVSVAAELLGRPRLLFLDEPTSGLDPATEHRLMETFRELAAHACTILCTTHVVENAHLFDKIAVMQSGRLVFFGPPAEAPAAFGVSSLGAVYRQLEEHQFPTQPNAPVSKPEEMPLREPVVRTPALPVLIARQTAMLAADLKNLALLAGQPVLIALLVTWVSSDPALILFFAYVATLWFGCGNAAQEIVREMAMFRRERLIGLGRVSYLASKFVTLSALTIAQALLMFGVMQACHGGLAGSALWQMTGLIFTACAAVAIGLAISAWARTILQAVMLVPLVLIPQILFAGFMPPAGEFAKGPFLISRAMPSASAQSVMDVSLFWNEKITGSLRVDFPSAFSNLNRDRSLKNGQVFQNPNAALFGCSVLLGWTALGLTGAWFSLRKRERG
jgi:ABC-type multidrug transport system ATPase subunit